MKKNYYEILGVSKDSAKDYIKRAYHLLAHQYHPDKEDGNEKRFKEINEAYLVLSDDESRNKYDKEITNGQGYNTNDIKEDQSNEIILEEEQKKFLEMMISWVNNTQMRPDRRKDILERISKLNGKPTTKREMKEFVIHTHNVSMGLSFTIEEVGKLMDLNNKRRDEKEKMQKCGCFDKYQLVIKKIDKYKKLIINSDEFSKKLKLTEDQTNKLIELQNNADILQKEMQKCGCLDNYKIADENVENYIKQLKTYST